MKEIKVVGIRLIEEKKLRSDKHINTPLDPVEILMKELSLYDREVAMVLNLDAKNRIVNTNVVAIGTVESCTINPREIFKSSILSNATSILLIHNHPSGDCGLSEEDIKVTYRIKA